MRFALNVMEKAITGSEASVLFRKQLTAKIYKAMKKSFFKATLMVIVMAVSIFAVDAASLNNNKPKMASAAVNAGNSSAGCDQACRSLMHSAKVVCGLSMVRGSCNVPGHGCKGFCDGNGDNYCDNCPGKCHAVTHQPK